MRIHHTSLGLTCLLAWVPMLLLAQFQIPNGGFENWTSSPQGNYEEPSGGWWTSLNSLTSLGAPVSVQKDSDAHSGSFSARLRSVQWGTLLIPGLLISGAFDIQNPNFLVQGQPYTELPEAFEGWYKYTEVGGDSAGIAALLTRWNTGTQRRDTVAIAALALYSSQSAWTQFDLPFQYLVTGANPDSLLVALVSSRAGEDFEGQVGNTLWIDDIALRYNATTAGTAAMESRPTISVRGDRLTITLPAASGKAGIRVMDMQGRLLLQRGLEGGSSSLDLPWTSGCYLVEVEATRLQPMRQVIAIQRP